MADDVQKDQPAETAETVAEAPVAEAPPANAPAAKASKPGLVDKLRDVAAASDVEGATTESSVAHNFLTKLHVLREHIHANEVSLGKEVDVLLAKLKALL